MQAQELISHTLELGCVIMTVDTTEPHLSSCLEKVSQHSDDNIRERRSYIAIACLTPLIIGLLWAWFYVFVHTHTIRAHLGNILILALLNVLLITFESCYDYCRNLHWRRRNRAIELESVTVHS